MAEMQIGTITEVNNKKALARVKVDDRVSDWLPMISVATAFKKHFIPTSVNDQVLVLNPFGNNQNGFILRGIYYKDLNVPADANDTTEVIEYKDGTLIKYDLEKQTLSINTPSKITIICKEAEIKADSVVIDSPKINLGKNGDKVVTTGCLCSYTGSPHPEGSSVVKAKK